MNPNRLFLQYLLLGALPLILLSSRGYAVTKVLGEGELLLLANGDQTQFGAIKILDIEPETNSVVYSWYLPKGGEVDFAGPDVSNGTVETQQVRGRAILAFGPFVFEWHGGGESKGILSGNGELGVVPLMMASSGIPDATRVRDARSGFSYEEATTRESHDPLGLAEKLAKMPKARLGVGVEETFEDLGMGTQEKAVKITRVDPKSKAYAAGLRKGQCILSMEGMEILSAEDFHRLHDSLNPNTPVSMVVFTGDNVQTFTFETEDRVPAVSETRPDPVLPEDLSPEQRRRIEAGGKAGEILTQGLEALRAAHYD